MYKVAIVEDEPIMREYLSNCIDWDKLSLKLCGVYEKKSTALEGITEAGADIIITDIKLPDSDGLTLLNDVLKINPSVQFVVISAYSDFENVKRAFKIGAVDYILKTEFEPSYLEQILCKTVQRIESVKKIENGNFRNFYENEQYLKKIFWSNDTSYKNNDDIKWCLQGETQDFSIAVIKLLNYRSISEKWKSEKELIKYGVYNIIKELLREIRHCEVFFNAYDEIILIFDKKFENKTEKVQAIIEILNREFEFIIASGIVRNNKDKSLAEMYAECVRIADYSFVSGRNKIVKEADVLKSVVKFDVITNTELFEKKLRNYEYEELTLFFKEMLNIKHTVVNIRSVQDFFYSCLISLFRHSKDSGFEFVEYEDIYSFVVESDLPKIVEYINNVLLYLEDVGFGKFVDIKNVETYILENYSKDINLKNIAEKFCFNYSYFSNKFVKKTGKTFKQYLTDVRLENAYRLIMKTDYSMAVISEMVGYKNYDNFSRSFAQKYGKRPTEIRKGN